MSLCHDDKQKIWCYALRALVLVLFYLSWFSINSFLFIFFSPLIFSVANLILELITFLLLFLPQLSISIYKIELYSVFVRFPFFSSPINHVPYSFPFLLFFLCYHITRYRYRSCCVLCLNFDFWNCTPTMSQTLNCHLDCLVCAFFVFSIDTLTSSWITDRKKKRKMTRTDWTLFNNIDEKPSGLQS